MAKKDGKGVHVSETPATQLLKSHQVEFTEHPYDYVEHGGTAHSAASLGLPEHTVVKTLVMQDQDAKPLIVLMHGDCKVSTKNLAGQVGAKSVEPCKPEAAHRLARARPCPCTSKHRCWSCRALPSMAGGAVFWCRSTRRCAFSCWVPRRCTARWQNRPPRRSALRCCYPKELI